MNKPPGIGPNSGIYDAQAFRIGKSQTVHVPHRYPDCNKVVARCGQFGWVVERDSRLAYWVDAFPNCPRCTR